MKLAIIPILTILLFPNICDASQDALNRGQELLKEIEPHFLGTPVYLNPDNNFKEQLKQKLLLAIKNIEQAHKDDTENPKILFQLGKAYSFGHDLDVKGFWQQSTEYLKKCLEMEPKHVQAHLYLGKNYMDAERFADAFELYKRANELDPKSEAQKFMAYSLMFQNKVDEAIMNMKSYVKSHPGDQEAHKALVALEKGNYSSNVATPKKGN